MDKTCIITSFEEFGSRSINASREVVKLLNNRINNITIKKADLKVSWNEIEAELDAIVQESSDYIILCGEAASYDCIKLEKFGTNECKGKDNQGFELIHEKTTVLETKIDIEKIKIDGVAISLSAGSYLCNRSYYLSLDKTKNKKTKVLFIHFPLIKEEGGNYEKEDLAQKLEKIIQKIIEIEE